MSVNDDEDLSLRFWALPIGFLALMVLAILVSWWIYAAAVAWQLTGVAVLHATTK